MACYLSFRYSLLIVAASIAIAGCAATRQSDGFVPVSQLFGGTTETNSDPIPDNTGKYMCPFTTDGTVALWVSKGIAARAGKAIGGLAGSQAGKELGNRLEDKLEDQAAPGYLKSIGGIFGRKAGASAGRKVALGLVGGEDYMRETSDQSFNSLDAMIVYMYRNYRTHEEWDQVYKLTCEIYTDIPKREMSALARAGLK